MVDEPLMKAESRVKRLELQAIAAYRAKHPDGPPWLELACITRQMWVSHVEKLKGLHYDR
jgi:hypothetical protein